MGKGELYAGFRCGDLRGSDLLEDPSIRWEDNIKMDHIKRGRGGMDWIDLVQDRDRWRALVNTVTNLRLP
jgi:hypothetical protein